MQSQIDNKKQRIVVYHSWKLQYMYWDEMGNF